jgi:hypothetical protein
MPARSAPVAARLARPKYARGDDTGPLGGRRFSSLPGCSFSLTFHPSRADAKAQEKALRFRVGARLARRRPSITEI